MTRTFIIPFPLPVAVKFPQISKIWSNQSAEGVSFLSCLTDLFAVSIYTCYSFVRGFPFR